MEINDNQIKTGIQKKIQKRIFLLTSAISLFMFFRGIFFIDNRWWWSLFLVVPLCILTLSAYKEEINRTTLTRLRVRYTIGWSTTLTLIFVLISALFITPFWWFGLFLVLIMMGVLGSFEFGLDENELSYIEKKRIVIKSLSVFLIVFFLFCVPSFVANAGKNPADGFSASWSPVESYNLYGMGSRNTEHVIARSWYATGEYYVNDYVNIIWSNQVANSARANLPFGNVKEKSSNAVKDGTILVGYKNDDYFMPTDEFKGDVARILLYMYMTYKDDGLDKDLINVGLMKTWSKQDPVDTREKERNDLIESQYGYNNKFVETPWLVGFIV